MNSTTKAPAHRLLIQWLLIFSAFSVIPYSVAAQSPSGRSQPTNNQILYYIPHTHWEGAVFKTREDYLTMGLPHLLKMLRLLKQFPDYKFTLDQVALIKPLLERYPEEAPAFRKFVAEGRLGSVRGMDVMP